MIEAKNFIDLIQKHNPFGFKNEDGSSKSFSDYKELYVYTTKEILTMAPRGFVDLPLFLHNQTKMPITYCARLVARWNSVRTEKGIFLIEVWAMDLVISKMEILLKALHTISGSKFDSSAFKEAVDELLTKEIIYIKHSVIC